MASAVARRDDTMDPTGTVADGVTEPVTPRPAPMVDYLRLQPEPHLVAHQCTSCAARYFDRRLGCAACTGTEFADVTVENAGVVRAFTIIGFAPPGITIPYVAAVVDCDGTDVRANLVDVEPSPAAVRTGMAVELCTFPVGRDANGVEAIGYGYRPRSGTTKGEGGA
jgi:uncharacterized OB-fold protein